MAELPTGTVTFLFTDIEGSTRLWKHHPDAMEGALARHDAIVRASTVAHSGVVFRTVGDAFCIAFATAPAALHAALDAQRALHREVWGEVGTMPVRMALHTCAAAPEGGDYRTGALNRLGRLLAVIHGRQVVLSQSTTELVRDTLPPELMLRDLGQHHLRDLHPEHIFQLLAPDLPADFPPLKTLDGRRHNLPSQPTTLIGRETESAAICSLLQRADVRLLTLTGPGGTGKTRLGVQAATKLLDDFRDGVWFVNLAPISDPSLIIPTIAQALGVRESGSLPLLDGLKDYLREKELLLLLDNFEQVAEAAPLIGELLAAAPGLNVLATSRMPLHLSSEYEYAVPPLNLPDPDGRPPLERLLQYPAVQLFIARAQAIRADFVVTDANAPAIAAICQRLDGLPLAIELAAARVKLLPPEALLARLDQALKLLTGGARDAPARQQTMRATIDWSYHLLSASEQRLFARLGEFVGGCTLMAAEAVCNADDDLPIDVLDGLAALLDKSLLKQEEAATGEPRFAMLETIREYALERLEASGEAEAIRQQFATYYLELAEAAAPQLECAGQETWLDRLEIEHDNLRAVLAWCQAAVPSEHSSELGARLAASLLEFWLMHSHWSEGRRWLEEVLNTNSTLPLAVRARALYAAGALAGGQGDDTRAIVLLTESLTLWRNLGDRRGVARALYELAGLQGNDGQAQALLAECLALFQELGDKSGIAEVLHTLGHRALDQGDDARATALFEQGLALERERENTHNIARMLTDLGQVALRQGDAIHAKSLFEASLAKQRELGDKACTAHSLSWLGEVALAQADPVHALALLEESQVLFREVGLRRASANALTLMGRAALLAGDSARATACYVASIKLLQELQDQPGLVAGLEGLASVACAQGQAAQAARLFGAADALHASVGTYITPAERANYERQLADARAQLGESTFAAAWAAGRAMTLKQAIAEALKVVDETL